MRHEHPRAWCLVKEEARFGKFTTYKTWKGRGAITIQGMGRTRQDVVADS
jgi:hypothetical protein